MRIALCDDEPAYHDTVKSLLSRYKQARPERSLTLSSFCSGRELLNHVDEYGGFDLYILDTVMPGMDGIALGLSLRGRGEAGMILYLTASADFALASYRVEAFQYLLKPVDAAQFFSVMDKAYRAFSRREAEVISVKMPDSVRVIPVPDIRCAERVKKRVCYFLTDGVRLFSATFNGTFQNAVSDLLAHGCMIPVGASFVVNLSHVTEVTREGLILTGAITVPIPRRMFEEVKARWADYWLNGGRYHAF